VKGLACYSLSSCGIFSQQTYSTSCVEPELWPAGRSSLPEVASRNSYGGLLSQRSETVLFFYSHNQGIVKIVLIDHRLFDLCLVSLSNPRSIVDVTTPPVSETACQPVFYGRLSFVGRPTARAARRKLCCLGDHDGVEHITISGRRS
jgi:hypothetical protein